MNANVIQLKTKTKNLPEFKHRAKADLILEPGLAREPVWIMEVETKTTVEARIHRGRNPIYGKQLTLGKFEQVFSSDPDDWQARIAPYSEAYSIARNLAIAHGAPWVLDRATFNFKILNEKTNEKFTVFAIAASICRTEPHNY